MDSDQYFKTLLGQTEQQIFQGNIESEVLQQNFKRNYYEPAFQRIFPTCEIGELIHCEENPLNETVEESCKGVLIFSNQTGSCSCELTGKAKRNRQNVRTGWSLYTRY